ncbi:hypothetical protein LINPERHAP1_LOCUS21014 [Linum perenne]
MLRLKVSINYGQRPLSLKFSRNPSRICRSKRYWSFCGPKLAGSRLLTWLTPFFWCDSQVKKIISGHPLVVHGSFMIITYQLLIGLLLSMRKNRLRRS